MASNSSTTEIRSIPAATSEGRRRARVFAISVCGFKSIGNEQKIEIRPITVLAGANNSGKSSVIQPLLMLKQTLEAPYDPGPLLLDGPNVRITSMDQLLTKVQGSACADRFIVRFFDPDGDGAGLCFSRATPNGIALQMVYRLQNHETTIHLDMANDEIEKVIPKEVEKVRADLEKGQDTRLRWIVRRERCFLTFNLQHVGPKSRQTIVGLGASPIAGIDAQIRGIIHVPGHRGNPERTYKTTAVARNFPGRFENYVASVISQWQRERSPRLDTLAKWLEKLGLTWKVEARQVDDTQVELRVGRLPHSRRGGAHDLVSIADVGFGVSQSLPVLVSLIVARPGQVVYIEEPELHLHPLAQSGLAEIIAEAAKRGVIVVVETHSSILLLGLRTLVARARVQPDDIALHWFTRSENGETVVSSARMDETGASEGWPEDFGEVSLKTEARYLDAVERRVRKAS